MGFLSWYKNVIKDTLKDIYEWIGWAYLEFGLGSIAAAIVGVFIPLYVSLGNLPLTSLAWILTLPVWITICSHGYYRIEHC